jgi:hypothetical protein
LAFVNLFIVQVNNDPVFSPSHFTISFILSCIIQEMSATYDYNTHMVGEEENNHEFNLTKNNNGQVFECSQSPSPLKKPVLAKKRRNPRKSLAPKKLLHWATEQTGPPPAGSLRRSSRTRDMQDMSTSSSKSESKSNSNSSPMNQLKVLKVVIPSDSVTFKVSMSHDDDDGLSLSDTDFDEAGSQTTSVEHATTIKDDNQTQQQADTSTSKTPPRAQSQNNYQGSSFTYTSPTCLVHKGSPTPFTATLKSPPNSILRCKKKPRLLAATNSDGVTVSIDDVAAVQSHDGGTPGDAQLDALLDSSSSSGLGGESFTSAPTTPTVSEGAGTFVAAAAAASGDRHQHDWDVDFDAECIQHRMSLLFRPDTYNAIQNAPCILPRLMACFTLYRDHDDEIRVEKSDSRSSTTARLDPTNTPKVTTRRRKRSLDGKTTAIQEIVPTRELLLSLVDLELTLLSNRGADADLCGNAAGDGVDGSQSPHTFHRKIQFAAFDTLDGSAVLCPPTDTLEGSYQSQQQCIRQLTTVLKAVQDLHGETVTVAKKSLQNFVAYLDGPFLLLYHDKVCASSLSLNRDNGTYPTSRIAKAAAAYSRDFESLLAYVAPVDSELPTSIGENVSPSRPTPRPPLVWEMRLADASAQLTRYWLRTNLNSVPERYEKNRNNSRAWKRRLNDLIDLEGRPGREDDEDPPSSLVSNALSHLYAYLGANPSRWKQRLLKHLTMRSLDDETNGPNSWSTSSTVPLANFCQSEICKAGLGIGRQPTSPLTKEEWKHVWDNFDSASAFLACYSRAVFIDQLLSIVLKVKFDKQWSKTVQCAAQPLMDLSFRDSTLSPTGTAIIQKEDAHLALLGWDITTLQTSLQDAILQQSVAKQTEAIRQNLLSSVSSFRLGGKKSKHKNAHQPYVGELESHWLEHLQPSLAFCTVKPRSETDKDN